MIMLAEYPEKSSAPFDELKRRLDAKGTEWGCASTRSTNDVFNVHAPRPSPNRAQPSSAIGPLQHIAAWSRPSHQPSDRRRL